MYDFAADNTAYRADIETGLVGRTIMTDLGGGKKIMYKIESINWGSDINTTFEKKGQVISIKDYYKVRSSTALLSVHRVVYNVFFMMIFQAQHNITLIGNGLPLLVSFIGKKSHKRECKLPAEICQITGESI